MIIVSTRVTVAVLARRIRSVESVVGVQRRQMMVMAQHWQMMLSRPGSVGAQRQISRSRTRRTIIIASVASIAAARFREVMVQGCQLMVVVVVTGEAELMVQVSVSVLGSCAAQDVVDHEPGTGRLKDGHRTALNWHRHLWGATRADFANL